MFSHIRTSKENKEIITKLTNKLNLGAENVIARIAIAYSLAQDEILDLKDLQDSGGKEYSKSVLFGEQFKTYIGLISIKHNIHSSDNNLSKYVKLHLDNGLKSLGGDIKIGEISDPFDFIQRLT
jgi:DNA sulfur modification protein DndE